ESSELPLTAGSGGSAPFDQGVEHPYWRGPPPAVPSPERAPEIIEIGRLGQAQGDEAPCRKIGRHPMPGHVAPADAFEKQGVLGPEIRQTPCSGAEHRELKAIRERGAVREHELQMVARFARFDIRAPGKRM